MNGSKSKSQGFTLLELVAVLMVLSIVFGLSLPAVQQVRETARQTSCQNRLKQQSLALLLHESSFRSLPAGAAYQTNHAWSARILPFLEQGSLYERFNFGLAWNAPDNTPYAQADLSVFHCPSSWKDYSGRTDYCGIRGSSYNTTVNLGKNGVLFPIGRDERPVKLRDIKDGTSHTMAIAEGVALSERSHGFWASGLNCIGHDNGGINNREGGFDEIASLHPGGAYSAFVDGSTRFIHQSVPLSEIAAMCVRDDGLIAEYSH